MVNTVPPPSVATVCRMLRAGEPLEQLPRQAGAVGGGDAERPRGPPRIPGPRRADGIEQRVLDRGGRADPRERGGRAAPGERGHALAARPAAPDVVAVPVMPDVALEPLVLDGALHAHVLEHAARPGHQPLVGQGRRAPRRGCPGPRSRRARPGRCWREPRAGRRRPRRRRCRSAPGCARRGTAGRTRAPRRTAGGGGPASAPGPGPRGRAAAARTARTPPARRGRAG